MTDIVANIKSAFGLTDRSASIYFKGRELTARAQGDDDAGEQGNPLLDDAAPGADLRFHGIITDSYSSLLDMFGLPQVNPAQLNNALKSLDGKDIAMTVNSPGGSVFAAEEMVQALKSYQGNISVTITGLCASAATFVALAGDSVEISSLSQFMIHNSQTCVCGDRHDLTDQAAVLERIDSQMAAMYTARSSMDKDAVMAAMDAETWMTPTEAVEQGFADAVLDANEDEDDEDDSKDEERMKAQRRLALANQRRTINSLLLHPAGITHTPNPRQEAQAA